MGIPNVGKSTLMNVVLKRKLAKVGDEPAVTRAQQTSQLDVRHSITDTPGLLWPKIEHPSDGLMLAASNAVGRNAMIDEEVATFLAGLLLARYPALLASATAFRSTPAPNRRGGGHRGIARTARPAPARRRSRSRKSGESAAAGLPRRPARAHQPGDAGDAQRHAGGRAWPAGASGARRAGICRRPASGRRITGCSPDACSADAQFPSLAAARPDRFPAAGAQLLFLGADPAASWPCSSWCCRLRPFACASTRCWCASPRPGSPATAAGWR
jgi:hypothetical protein